MRNLDFFPTFKNLIGSVNSKLELTVTIRNYLLICFSISLYEGKVLVALAERKSRCCMILVSEDKKASSVSQAILKATAQMHNNFKTVTCDNGKEFALHEKLSRELSAQWCFAHPYHSWKRGYCENTNGLVRQYFPKVMDF